MSRMLPEHLLRHLTAGLVLLTLSACQLLPPPEPRISAKPRTSAPSAARAIANSEALRTYYQRVLQDGQSRGLLRTDGGGPDTPYTADLLARNFEEIAFFNEYERGDQPLRRWAGAVRVDARFGDTTNPANQTRDQNALISFVNRLGRVTKHPISMAGPGQKANFHVYFVNEAERSKAVDEIRKNVPGLDASTLASIRDLPRSTYCLVVALTGPGKPSTYTRAVAIIRTEQPDLMRLSCIHEEIAQGLGLANDSPYARPSIFNDDDEFALLTSHDEKLLTMLYDPRLRIGTRIEAARPLLRILAREVMGVEL